MRFAEAVKLLAAPFSLQAGFLGDIPENASVPGFRWHNNVFRMAALYRDSTAVLEGDGGTEGVEHWRARTQLPDGATLPTQWLTIGVYMLMDLEKPFLFTRHGLRSAHEWRLIRYLAGEVCDAQRWPRELQYPNFKCLWDELSGGVLTWEGS